MATAVTLKVYTKEDKLKLLVRDSKVIKTISIYKYNEEIVDCHSFILPKGEFVIKPYQAYYEFLRTVGRDFKESVAVTELHIEHNEMTGDLEFVRTTTNIGSGNVYEKRKKYFNGRKYEIEFKNGEVFDFEFLIREEKINEYLKKTKDEQEN